MKYLFSLITSVLNSTKNFKKMEKIKSYKKLYCIESPGLIIRYMLAESKYEVMERIKSQDDYKFESKDYKITTKK